MGFVSCKGSADAERAVLHLLPSAFLRHCPAPAVPPTHPLYLGIHWGAQAAGQFHLSSWEKNKTLQSRGVPHSPWPENSGAPRGRCSRPPPALCGRDSPAHAGSGRILEPEQRAVLHRAVSNREPPELELVPVPVPRPRPPLLGEAAPAPRPCAPPAPGSSGGSSLSTSGSSGSSSSGSSSMDLSFMAAQVCPAPAPFARGVGVAGA